MFIENVRWNVSNRTVLSLKVKSTPIAVAKSKLELCILQKLNYFLPTDKVIEIMGPPGLWVAKVVAPVACIDGICVVEVCSDVVVRVVGMVSGDIGMVWFGLVQFVRFRFISQFVLQWKTSPTKFTSRIQFSFYFIDKLIIKYISDSPNKSYLFRMFFAFTEWLKLSETFSDQHVLTTKTWT